MALKGQLHDFNLAEILQLIASQQKSGFLVLEGHREMVFIFDKGVLISTRDRRSEAPDPWRPISTTTASSPTPSGSTSATSGRTARST